MVGAGAGTHSRVAIGVMAHNEARNIGRLLERLTAVHTDDLQIIVVASGCNDGTVAVAERAARADSRVLVLADPERRGKAVAINQFIDAARGAEILVMESADTLPESGAIEALLRRFDDPKVGMVGAHPLPEDEEDTFVGFAVQLLWRLHHAVATRSPKQGELVAWRNVISAIPPEAAVDEAYLEAEIVRKGYVLAYEPRAIVRNRGAATVGAFVTQRRRIHAGHRALAASARYRPATRDHFLLLRLALTEVARRPTRLHWILGAALLELWASILGLWDHRIARRGHAVWDVVAGTKALAGSSRRPNVVVLVVTYNGGSDILECLASVKRQTYPEFGVLVVDNGSTDGTFDRVRAAYPDIELMRVETNEGLARGFNAGIERALSGDSEYVLLLSDDVVIARDHLDQAVLAAVAEPRAASVSGPVFYYDEPERLWYGGAEIAWWLGKTFHRGRRVIWGPEFQRSRKIGYSSAAAALYNASALRSVGGWDERWFLVFEDSDWCVRAGRAGWYHRYVPGPRAWHRVSASFGGEKAPLYLYFLFRNNLRFMWKHARPWHWPTFLVFFTLESLARYTLSSLITREPVARELAIWLAIVDAARGRFGRGSSGLIVRFLGRRQEEAMSRALGRGQPA